VEDRPVQRQRDGRGGEQIESVRRSLDCESKHDRVATAISSTCADDPIAHLSHMHPVCLVRLFNGMFVVGVSRHAPGNPTRCFDTP
jgi:hypothetical protein